MQNTNVKRKYSRKLSFLFANNMNQLINISIFKILSPMTTLTIMLSINHNQAPSISYANNTPYAIFRLYYGKVSYNSSRFHQYPTQHFLRFNYCPFQKTPLSQAHFLSSNFISSPNMIDPMINNFSILNSLGVENGHITDGPGQHSRLNF